MANCPKCKKPIPEGHQVCPVCLAHYMADMQRAQGFMFLGNALHGCSCLCALVGAGLVFLLLLLLGH